MKLSASSKTGHNPWMFILLFSWTAAAAINTATVEINNVVLDKPYAAMQGPNQFQLFDVPVKPGTRAIWLTSFDVKVTDALGAVAPMYLCHSRLGTVAKAAKLDEFQNVRADPETGMRG